MGDYYRTPWNGGVSDGVVLGLVLPAVFDALSCTKHVWYSEHGMYCRFEIILERVMSATHVAVILCTRTSPAYEEEFTKMDYPNVRNEYSTS